jgi:hypothetical protein
MDDVYTRKFLCIIRWFLYFSGVVLYMLHYGKLGFTAISCAVFLILIGDKYRYRVPIMKRYRWYGITSVVYYLALMIYVITIKGQIFDQSLIFEALFVLPFIPEFISFEIDEYHGKGR